MYLDAKKNELWLGLMNTGLCAVDLSDYSYKFYTDPETIEGVSSNNDVKAIYIDKDDMIWLGTDYGLKIFNRKSNTYLRYRFESENKSTLSSNQVSCIYEDGNKVIWIGTWGGGLNKFERSNKKITQINPAALNGLQMNAITSDLAGNLWISTNNGLIKFQTKTLDCQLYDKNDGIVNIEFNSGAFCKNPKGVLYFGGIDGVTYFQPNRVNGINANKVILINKVYSESNQISIDYTDLLKPIVNIDYSKNNLTIDYITINYSNPEKVQYAYYLEGYNKDWIATGSNHTAVFANLPPGKYYFHFKSSLGEGNWKESEQVLTVIIIPPFYRTWWFYLLLALCIGALSYYAYITRKKRLQFIKEREVQNQSAKMKQLFLANMSHEIRTPMNSVVGFTELLAKTNLTDEQSGYVHAISNSSANLLVLINDILDYSKLEALSISLNKQPFDIIQLIDKVYATLFLKAKEKKLRFLINVDDQLPKLIIGDEIRLSQVLINILNNAIKFTHSGYVALDLKATEKTDTAITIQFVISDTGIGISSEKLPHIFESFTQVSNDTSKLYGGTGLGLAISKQLIELQAGSIQVQSEINKGTQFFIALTFDYPQSTNPMPTDGNPEKGDKEQLPKDIKNEKLNLLIAEDNQFNQLLVKNIIAKNFPNFEITIVENGLLVLEKMKTEDFDFILMDIQMPEMNGIEATKEIRNHPETYTSNIPIIACTAGVTPSEIQNCYDAGMNDFIGKPFKPDELIAKIQNLFNPII